jgi:hypothetical protein
MRAAGRTRPFDRNPAAYGGGCIPMAQAGRKSCGTSPCEFLRMAGTPAALNRVRRPGCLQRRHEFFLASSAQFLAIQLAESSPPVFSQVGIRRHSNGQHRSGFPCGFLRRRADTGCSPRRSSPRQTSHRAGPDVRRSCPPAELIGAVDSYAAKAGINRSEAMHQLIEAGLKRPPKAL